MANYTDPNRIPSLPLIEYDVDELEFYTSDEVKTGHFLTPSENFEVSIATGDPAETLFAVATAPVKNGKVSARIFSKFVANCVITGGPLAAGTYVKPNGSTGATDATKNLPQVVAITPVTDPKVLFLVSGGTAGTVGKFIHLPQGYITGA